MPRPPTRLPSGVAQLCWSTAVVAALVDVASAPRVGALPGAALFSATTGTAVTGFPVNRHFTVEGHKEGDFKVVGLERTWGNSEDRRKFREMRWVGLLGTQRDSEGENVRREG